LDPYQHLEEGKVKRGDNAAYTVKDDKRGYRRPLITKRFIRKAPTSYTVICWCCKEPGHAARTCKKLRSTLDQFHKKRDVQGVPSQYEEQAMIIKGSIYLDS